MPTLLPFPQQSSRPNVGWGLEINVPAAACAASGSFEQALERQFLAMGDGQRQRVELDVPPAGFTVQPERQALVHDVAQIAGFGRPGHGGMVAGAADQGKGAAGG